MIINDDISLKELRRNLEEINIDFLNKLESTNQKIDKEISDVYAAIDLHLRTSKNEITDTHAVYIPPSPITLHTPSIQRCQDFVRDRLLPALAEWLPDVRTPLAELFHHAIRACRWVLVPNPAWALGYNKAMGGTTRVQIVQVEPTWLCFTDAWKGAIEQFWVSAQQEPEYLYLLLLEDVNRALPECWARPWLDLLAGFRETLPTDRHPGWPPNLRILACPASDQTALPLSVAVVKHWAAVSPSPIGSPASLLPMREGHVSWTQWQEWGGQDTSTQNVAEEMRDVYTTLLQPLCETGKLTSEELGDFGSVIPSVVHDLRRLALSLKSTRPEQDIDNIAANIRIHWPLEYIRSTHDE
jgi:hypothetical protein